MKAVKHMLLCLMLLTCITAFARKQPVRSSVKPASGSRLAVDSLVITYDDLLTSLPPSSPAVWLNNFSIFSTKGRALLQVKEDTATCMPDTFSCSVGVRMIWYNQSNQVDSVDTVLTVTYNKTQGTSFRAKDFYEVDGAHYLIIKILSVSNPSVRNFVELNAEIDQERFKNTTLTDLTTRPKITAIDATVTGEIQVSFALVEWAEEYDLEWTFIEAYDDAKGLAAAGATPFDLRWNTSRVTINTTTYKISNVFEKGYLICRVRAVGRGGAGYGQRLEGAWSITIQNGKVSDLTNATSDKAYLAISTEHENLLNWQYQAVYAEEGKRNESIGYFDGSLRSRQSVTRSVADTVAIVQETIYDHQGRPAVQVLPAPASPDRLQYFANFNRSSAGTPYTKSNFDLDNGACLTAVDSMKNNSGASKYYSVQNSWTSAVSAVPVPKTNDYVAVANGFPFVQTEYTRDNTGRVSRQSMPGISHKLESGHETGYYYAVPFQEELDRLFGNEVGYSGHYKKNMVRDANGQFSVSYLHPSGRVIATALAGDAPASTTALASNISRSDLSVNLMDGNDSAYAADALVTTRSFVVTAEADYRFYYSVQAESYKPGCVPANFCADCVYDLEISLLNKCAQQQLNGNTLVPSQKKLIKRTIGAANGQYDTRCDNVVKPVYSFKTDTLSQKILTDTFITVHLFPGEYSISKTLSVNQDALDYYTERYIDSNTCRTFAQLEQEAWSRMDTSGCETTCQSCTVKLGTQSAFVSSFIAGITRMGGTPVKADTTSAIATYLQEKLKCDKLCDTSFNMCDAYYSLLKADITPGSQYSGYTLVGADSVATGVPGSFISATPSGPGAYSYSTLHIYNGDTYFTTHGETTGGVYKNYSDMSTGELIRCWKDSFADHLVVLHPEYCQVQWCNANAASARFDEEMLKTETYAEAKAKGFLNPVDSARCNVAFIADPFFKAGGPGYGLTFPGGQTLVQNLDQRMRKFQVTVELNGPGTADDSTTIFSAWDVGIMKYYCNGETNVRALRRCVNVVDSNTFKCGPFGDYFWTMFRSIYMAQKAGISDSLSRRGPCLNLNNNGIPPGKTFRINNSARLSFIDGDPEEMLNDAKYDFAGACDDQCNSYADYWMMKLKGCSLNAADSQQVRERLIEVCKNGCDPNNGFGASSIDPQRYGPSTDSSFHDVLVKMHKYIPGICDDIFISYPLPFVATDKKLKAGPAGNNGKCGCTETVVATSPGYVGADPDWCALDFDITPGDTGIVFPTTGDSTVMIDSYQGQAFVCSTCNDDLATAAGAFNFARHQADSVMPPAGIIQGCNTCITECADCKQMYNNLKELKAIYPDSVLTVDKRYTIITRFLNRKFGFSGLMYNDYLGAMLLCMDTLRSSAYYGARASRDSAIFASYMYWGHQVYDNEFVIVCDTALVDRNVKPLDTLCTTCGTCNGPLIADLSGIAGRDDLLSGFIRTTGGAIIPVDTADFSTTRGGTLWTRETPNAKISCHVLRGIISAFDLAWRANPANAGKSEAQRDKALEDHLNAMYGTKISLPMWLTIIAHCREQSEKNNPAPGAPGDCCELKLNKCMSDSLSEFFKRYFTEHNQAFNQDPGKDVVKDINGSSYDNSLFLHRFGPNPPQFDCKLRAYFKRVDAIPALGTNPGMPSYYQYMIIDECKHDTQYIKLSIPFITGFPDIDSLGDISRAEAKCYPQINRYLFKVKAYFTKNNVRDSVWLDGYESSAPVALPRALNCSVKICDKPMLADTPLTCKQELRKVAHVNALLRYKDFTDSLRTAFRNAYVKKCMNARGKETFVMKYTDRQYHYTLYYYDQAGNLAKTVPPQGVMPFNADSTAMVHARRIAETPAAPLVPLFPAHYLVSQYAYNTLNQVQWQSTPDAGESNFYYDRVSRLVLSANAKQKPLTRYSYTSYDVLGRIRQVGELQAAAYILRTSTTYYADVDNLVASAAKTQVTATLYDEAVIPLPGFAQDNLRNRVATTTYSEYGGSLYQYAAYYTYDVAGNVTRLVRENKSLESIGHDLKTIDYDFDVISGKVNAVYYQLGEADQYIHKYTYDRDNRLSTVYSSPSEAIMYLDGQRERDAKYAYYLHGPVSRTLLGELSVQGVDYAYTIQGWLKAVNSETLAANRDMGRDGWNGSAGNLNRTTARDVYGFALQYYDADYQPARTPAAVDYFMADRSGSGLQANTQNLYNGNISMMTTAIGKLMETNLRPLAASCRYDQLNRIASADYYSNVNTSANTWQAETAMNAWHNRFTYDANGNIITQVRRSDNKGDVGFAMDSLEYEYYPNTNRLRRVKDAVAAGLYSDDIDDQAAVTNNYGYDPIGNLIRDVAEEIDTISWNVYGKITRIRRIAGSAKPDIEFAYSPDGYRVLKVVIPKAPNAFKRYTYYMRDAQGNIMATYDRVFEKIIDYDSLQYAAVNDSVIKYSSLAGFGSFIGTLHSTVLVNTGFNNSLETQTNATAALQDSFLYAMNPLTLLLADTSVYNGMVTQYDSLMMVNAVLNQLYTNKMLIRGACDNCVGADNLKAYVMGDSLIFEYFLRSMAWYNVSDFNIVSSGLSCTSLSAGFSEASLNSVMQCLRSKNKAAVLDRLGTIARYKNCAAVDSVFDKMYTQYPAMWAGVVARIPNIKRIIAGSHNTTCFTGTKNSVINLLNSISHNYLWSRITAARSRSFLVGWYKANELSNFLSTVAIRQKSMISSYQQGNNMYSAGGNGMEAYFGLIKNQFGQVFYDNLLLKFYNGSRSYTDTLKVNEWMIYGASRLGSRVSGLYLVSVKFYADTLGGGFVNRSDIKLNEPVFSPYSYVLMRGKKQYELTNHLGNVLAVISDKKIFSCGENILYDDFNNGEINGWEATGGANNSYAITVASSRLQATLTAAASGTPGVIKWFNRIVLGDGLQYEISFDFDKGTADGVCVNVAYTDNTTSAVQCYSATGSYRFILTTAAGKSMRYVRFSVSTAAVSGKYFYLDNVKVRRYETDSVYYIADMIRANDYSVFGAPMSGRSWSGGRAVKSIAARYAFTTATTGWTAVSNNTVLSLEQQALKAVATSSTVPSGVKADIATRAGRTYRVRFSADFTVRSTFLVKDVSSGKQLLKTGLLDYGYNTVEFTAVGNTSQIQVVQSTGTYSMWIDDVTVYELENEYVFGFNGMEKDDEVSGAGNSYTAEFWEYDARLGRRWNIDPVTKPWESAYATFSNNPIVFIDPNGLDPTPTLAPVKGQEPFYPTPDGKAPIKTYDLPEFTLKVDRLTVAPHIGGQASRSPNFFGSAWRWTKNVLGSLGDILGDILGVRDRFVITGGSYTGENENSKPKPGDILKTISSDDIDMFGIPLKDKKAPFQSQNKDKEGLTETKNAQEKAEPANKPGSSNAPDNVDARDIKDSVRNQKNTANREVNIHDTVYFRSGQLSKDEYYKSKR